MHPKFRNIKMGGGGREEDTLDLKKFPKVFLVLQLPMLPASLPYADAIRKAFLMPTYLLF